MTDTSGAGWLMCDVMPDTWPFDQAPDVAAITTRQVLEDKVPILRATHYSDDDSWAFTCGTTNKAEDIRVIGMAEALELDPSLRDVADLPPGWTARRDSTSGEWHRRRNDNE